MIAPWRSFVGLLGAKRDQWVDGRRAPGGYVARQQRDGGEENRHADEAEWIGRADIDQLRKYEPSTPITTPAAASLLPWRTTRLRMLARLAPSATRTPISWVRCATEYERTPYTPIAASSSPTPPKSENIHP